MRIMQSDILARACEEADMPVSKFITVEHVRTETEASLPSVGLEVSEHEIQEAVLVKKAMSNSKPKFKVYSVRKKTKRLHSCVECGELFANAYALKHHNSKMHTEKRLHPCLECGLQFETPTELQYHLPVHSRNRKHECPFCKDTFANYVHLGEHLKIHYQKKQYLCQVCGKEFTYECNLKRHELIHIHEPHIEVIADVQGGGDKGSDIRTTDNEVMNPEAITAMFENEEAE